MYNTEISSKQFTLQRKRNPIKNRTITWAYMISIKNLS